MSTREIATVRLSIETELIAMRQGPLQGEQAILFSCQASIHMIEGNTHR